MVKAMNKDEIEVLKQLLQDNPEGYNTFTNWFKLASENYEMMK